MIQLKFPKQPFSILFKKFQKQKTGEFEKMNSPPPSNVFIYFLYMDTSILGFNQKRGKEYGLFSSSNNSTILLSSRFQWIPYVVLPQLPIPPLFLELVYRIESFSFLMGSFPLIFSSFYFQRPALNVMESKGPLLQDALDVGSLLTCHVVGTPCPHVEFIFCPIFFPFFLNF